MIVPKKKCKLPIISGQIIFYNGAILSNQSCNWANHASKVPGWNEQKTIGADV